MKINEIKNKLFNKQDLSVEETTFIFDLIMSGDLSEIDTAAILISLKIKNESKNEIMGAVKIMRKNAEKIDSPKNTIDTCGTGGDLIGTLNISTSSALIAASAGAVVAKHGNRSVSSKSGSADMLEKLGIKLTSEKKLLEKSLEINNFCFLFAQFHHSAMKHVINIRKNLATRTIFNLIGPLTNPASAKKQLIGVFDKKWINIYCEVLKDLGSNHAMIVHGDDGMDEISLSSVTHIAELKENKIFNFIFNPKDYGYEFINNEDIIGKGPEYNAKVFIDMLNAPNNSFQKIVEINAGAALYLAGQVKNLKDGFILANKTINNYQSKKYIENLLRNQ